jgi:hypothetical protein
VRPTTARVRPALLAAALVWLALPAVPREMAAQELRSLDVARQLHDSAALLVRVRYAAGKLAVRATEAPVLYRMQLAYQPDAVRPLYSFAAATRTLRVGVEKRGMRVPGGDRGGDMHLDLARAVPVDLDMELGAVEADLDLSGLRVGELHVESGASDARLRFATPNAERMRSLDLEVGAASLHASGLANANAPEIRVQAGVGGVELDFDGTWTQSIDLNVRVALGGVTVRVPRDVGVRVEAQKFLASFDAQGLVKRGTAYYSDNWETATHRLSVRAQTTFGSFRLERTARQ